MGLWTAGYAHRKITERCQVSVVRGNGVSPTRLVDGVSSESMTGPTRLILDALHLGELPAVAVAGVKAEPHEADKSRPQSSPAPLPPKAPLRPRRFYVSIETWKRTARGDADRSHSTSIQVTAPTQSISSTVPAMCRGPFARLK